MNIDNIVYQNMEHLIEKSGLTERLCTTACNLNPNFFVNYRKGRTKHFRICDLVEIAAFFDVSLDYLCHFENTRDDMFLPRYKLKARDEKVIMYGIRRLDPVGRINIAEHLGEEIKASKERIKQNQKQQKS